MKKFLLLMGLLCTTLHIYAQRSSKPVDSLKLSGIDYFTTDQYGSIYLISFNRLIKLDENRNKIFTYSNPILGSIRSVSAFDPLNLLLFYQDQQQITTLDNRLNESVGFNFTDEGLKDVQLISQSDENNVWIYEQSTDKLYRINLSNKRITDRSLNITQILNVENQPIQLECSIEKVYLNVPEVGIMVFDATGALNRTIPVKGIRHFTIGNHKIYYLKNDILVEYDLQKNLERTTGIDAMEGRFIAVSGNQLMVLYPGWLKFFRIN